MPSTEEAMPTAPTESCSYLPLAVAARLIPPTRGERPVHVSTLTRWITKGVLKSGGTRVKLQARRFPGGWKVTREALNQFIDELTDSALGGESDSSTIQPSSARNRELARVDAELLSAGF
jgi:hypothetical protein